MDPVVITGMGTVNPLGCNVSDTWQSLLNGQSGIRHLDDVDETLRARIGGTVSNFCPGDVLTKKELRQYDKFIHYGAVAADQAVKDAQLIDHQIDPCRIGVILSSGIGGLATIEDNVITARSSGHKRVSPYVVPGAIINMLSGYVSLKYNFKGPTFAVVSACSSSTHAIAVAHRHLLCNDLDIVIVGGAEACSHTIGLSFFSAIRALSTQNTDPTSASRPWDKSRDGFVMADGAAVLVMEKKSHALKRGAQIHAACSGVGMSSDAYHFVQPDVTCDGAVRSMRNALNDAKLDMCDIQYINAHATSTGLGDPIEPKAVEIIAPSAHEHLVMSSTKSMHGHLLGATGALESLITIEALKNGVVPPTINCDHPDVDTKIDLVRHHAQERKIKHAMSNSFGFGGTNASLIFSQCEH